MQLGQFDSSLFKNNRRRRPEKLREPRQSIQPVRTRFQGSGLALVFTASVLGMTMTQAQPALLPDVPKPRLFVSHQKQADLAVLAPFDLVVLDHDCVVDTTGARAGQHSLARIMPMATIGESNEDWLRRLDAGIVAPALKRGFDGIVLDAASGYTAARVSALIKEYRLAHPNALFVLCNPAAELDATVAKCDGVIFEGVHTSRDESPPFNDEARVRHHSAGTTAVYVVEFAKATAPDEAARLADSVTALGAIPFVTTKDETGASLAPVRERPRRVLVLFGWDAKEAEKPATWPADTMISDLLQTPLEWLGYETDYLDIGKADPPRDTVTKYAAVILDGDLDIPLAKEPDTARWLVQSKDDGVPVLFTGSFPFQSDEARRIITDGFDLKGSLLPMPNMSKAAIQRIDKTFLGAEAPAEARVNDYRDLAAPDGAHVLVSLQARNPDGVLVRYDPVFLAPWGGMWLEPYVVFRASADSNLFYADPYRILSALFSRRGPLPAPDATTRDGRRIFYSHIDGDGFATEADFRGHPLCAEVIRDRILKVFPFPVTASVIEADMRTLAEGLNDKDRDRILATARSIFAMPNVRVASHSFSHPYQWDADDPNPGVYDEPNMPLKPAANYPKIDIDREIRGSVDFINQHLAPEGKHVELMLWSGNCRPGVRALQACRELGLENMNGGNTIISRLYPGIAGIASRVTQWGDELQINAANQNEFMYANGWQGPFYGGFADVIDTFERTDAGRRTKPVNVYYHFYSATNLSSISALEKIYRWCADHDLHSVTALQYAHLVKDAWRTKVYELGPRRWLLANRGDARTFRLPRTLGRPDMTRCGGITGFIEQDESIYVHTLGRPLTELVLTDATDAPATADTAHLRLASCTAEIEFENFDPLKITFTVNDIRPVTAEFAGLQPKAVCELTTGSTTTRVTADEQGRVRLSLPASARVTLDATRSRYASLR